MLEQKKFIVTADWLLEHLGQPKTAIIDGSWYLPTDKRNPEKEYNEAHIPGAVFFDQDKICDETSGLPHSLPHPDVFAMHVSEMGIDTNDKIIVYDSSGFFSAPRVWWMFRVMGAKHVYVLDGGFDNWKAEKRPVTDKKTIIEPSQFVANFKQEQVVILREMRHLVNSRQIQIADARPHKRFTGEDLEPRENMRSGHMPGARNIPASLMSENGRFKDLQTIQAIFEDAGIDVSAPIVTSCGSGVTAAVLALALESLGNKKVRLYDGSWREWGALADTPIVMGEADEVGKNDQ